MNECLFMDRALLIRVLQQGLDLRGKGEPVMVNAVVEGLDPDAVADQPELPFFGVPEADGEHAAEFVQAVDAPLLEGMDDDLGVRVVRLPSVPADLDQFSPDLSVVVDLAVEHDLDAVVLVGHGLVRDGRQVDDREAAVPQADLPVRRDPSPSTVRAAMDHGVPHLDEVRLGHRKGTAFINECSDYSAHNSSE